MSKSIASLQTKASRFQTAALFLFLAVFPAAAAPIKFDIPAQPAAAALQLFGQQASVEVAYPASELKLIRAAEVKGELEPAAAIERLLSGTGYTARQTTPTNFAVTRAPPAPGSVSGMLIPSRSGRSLDGVTVTVLETGGRATVSGRGEFKFSSLAPGTYTIVANGEGFSRLRITDVVVRTGIDTILDAQDLPVLRSGDDVQTMKEVLVSAKKDFETLAAVEVSADRVKPFSTGNMDAPRSINDVQPYYVFDGAAIDRSGAFDIEDFLKENLTMNQQGLTNAQTGNSPTVPVEGNKSQINLRGLGTDKTLILINGRRQAGAMSYNSSDPGQPDLNGIPLSAIDRIEVLPSSAAGIYGGGALGGVVNVILKRDYSGGEFRATYDTPFDTDAPKRSVSVSYGMTLERGRTRVMLNTAWSDGSSLLMQDRRSIFERNMKVMLANNPAYFFASAPLGALPNIVPSAAGQTALTLKNGTVIPSGMTYVPAGTSPDTTVAVLAAGLAANGGSWSTQLPNTIDPPTGLLRQLTSRPETKSFNASVRRQMLPKLEAFADFSYSDNHSELIQRFVSNLTVPVSAPTNPFTTAVRIVLPYGGPGRPTIQTSNARSATLGVVAQLPWNWTGEFDYSRSESRFSLFFVSVDNPGTTAALASGDLNPFVDTVRYPWTDRTFNLNSSPRSLVDDFSLRGSGPLHSLPWGTPTLRTGLQHRIANVPQRASIITFPLSPAFSNTTTYFRRHQVTDSIYAEITVPMVKMDWLPFVHTLDLQASGRNERFTVDTGTPSSVFTPSTGVTTYAAPTLKGQPFYSKTSYGSTNGTVGIKYQPSSQLTLRASWASAFLPPTPSQLIKNPEPSATTTTITDPVTNQPVAVTTLSGGNPDLTPQNSKSLNGGVIWTPPWSRLRGLRLNAEYYRIDQDNAIGTLPAQTIVSLEKNYPGRVVRDATGNIVQVDLSSLNLYKRETEGWDLSADYTFKIGDGTFNLRAAESIVLHLKNQFSPTLPQNDAVNFPSEGGGVKYNGNATLAWNVRGWRTQWTARHVSTYKQNGAAGGPSAIQRALTGTTDALRAPLTTYTLPQGGDTIPSQTYHDVLVSHAFSRSEGGARLRTVGASLLSGLTVQIGVRNLFNQAPPLDAFYQQYLYESPFGDLRMRSYWINLKKTF